MAIKKINGLLFENMVRNGLNNIRNHEKQINEMNVFPVPDGDTGTNMRMTVENGVMRAGRIKELNEYLKNLSSGMLLGARGNSGVILSQIFSGLYQILQKEREVTVLRLVEGLVGGYKTAYNAVVRPVEGTLLTVAREGAEHTKEQVDKNTGIDTMLSIYLAEMKKTLSYTPEMLPVLKEAGVVDSGGMGYVVIVEGMLRSLYGEIITSTEDNRVTENEEKPDDFNENSDFNYGYCMEFLLQLMKTEGYLRRFNLDRYIDDLKSCGNSLVAIQDGTRVKVHIHTFKPARIISISQEYGEFVTFKLENMNLQAEAKAENAEKIKKSLVKVAVGNGEGILDLYKNLGCDIVIDGGPTMNTSTQEFISAFRRIEADDIVVLPNNKNVIRAAEQAVAVEGLHNVTVLPTRSYAEGYYALAMDIGDEDNAYRIEAMKRGAQEIDTLSVASASRDFDSDGIKCKKGEKIALLNGEIVYAESKLIPAVIGGLKKTDISDKEALIVFRGAAVTDETVDEAVSEIENNFDIEVNVVDGGQGVFDFVIGMF